MALPAPTMLTERSYDSGSCRTSWISYVRADLSAVSSWMSQLTSASAFERQDSHPTVTVTRTSVETVVVPKTTECDGFPRVTSVGVNTKSWVETTILEDVLGAAGQYIPDMIDGPAFPPYPNCTIKLSDCKEQWTHFKEFFANWTAPADELVASGYRDPDMCMMHPMLCPSKRKFNMDAWVSYRFRTLSRGFFDQCPEPVRACLANKGFMGIPRDMGFNKDEPPIVEPDCEVNIGRFVLIYFPPTGAKESRDLCANSQWGDFITVNVTESHLVTATMKHITFQTRPGTYFRTTDP
jgi:hypothetical protein